jgi:hypothetical protein
MRGVCARARAKGARGETESQNGGGRPTINKSSVTLLGHAQSSTHAHLPWKRLAGRFSGAPGDVETCR